MEFSICRAGKKLYDVCTALASRTTQTTVSLLQEATHNVPTNSFLLNVGHNASQSASSGMRIHLPPVHTKIAGFNTYATYVPTIDVSHKAVYCLKRHGRSTSQGAAGPSSSKGIKPKPLMPSWN